MIEQATAPPSRLMSIRRRLFASYPDVVQTIQHLDPSFQLHIFHYFCSKLFTDHVSTVADVISTSVQDARRKNPQFHYHCVPALFEGLSYFSANFHLKPDELLLNTTDTQTIFRAYNANQHIPDGLIVKHDKGRKRTVITGVTEYTTAREVAPRKLRQSKFYETGDVLKCLFGDPKKVTESIGTFLKMKNPNLPSLITRDPNDYRVMYTYIDGAETLPDREHVYNLPIGPHELEKLGVVIFQEAKKLAAVLPSRGVGV